MGVVERRGGMFKVHESGSRDHNLSTLKVQSLGAPKGTERAKLHRAEEIQRKKDRVRIFYGPQKTI